VSRVADAFPPVRLAVVAALAAPVVVLGAVPPLQFADWAWVSLCLAAPVVVWGAAPFHRTAWRALRRGTATAETLVSAAVLAGTVWSLALLSPGEPRTLTLRDRFWVLPGRDPAPGDHIYLAVAVLLTVAALAGRTGGSGPRSPARAATGGAGPYAVVVAVLAGGAFGFWLTAGGPGRATGTAAAVLVAACPAAVALAVPAAHLRAARRGAQLGVRVRTPAGLARATQVDTIVFAPADLTGTGDGAGTGDADRVVELSAAGAVPALRELGLRTVLLTPGDPQGSLALAGRVGIAEVFAEIVPRDRIAVVRRLQNEGRIVAFVGDAADVHDRSALAQADLGLGRAGPAGPAGPGGGGGGDRDGRGDGDLGLADGDLWNAADAVRLARATRRTAARNEALAYAGSGAILPLAVAGQLTPLVVLAAAALAGLAIAASSQRLRSFRSARPPAHQRP
jgi:cation transport ATPase